MNILVYQSVPREKKCMNVWSLLFIVLKKKRELIIIITECYVGYGCYEYQLNMPSYENLVIKIEGTTVSFWNYFILEQFNLKSKEKRVTS